MLIRKGFKCRLKTVPAQEDLLRRFAGCCRFVWNRARALQKERLGRGEGCLGYPALAALLPAWKVRSRCSRC